MFGLAARLLILLVLAFCGTVFAAVPTGTLITNVAEASYRQLPADDLQKMQSNPVQATVAPAPGYQGIGLAKSAGTPVFERDPATGALTGVIRVRTNLVVQGFSTQPLAAVQVVDVLEGADRFGTYTAADAPLPHQYTIVPGSLRVDVIGGDVAARPNPAYDGTAAHAELLAAGATLGGRARFVIRFDLRVNATGIDGVRYNTAQVSATSGTAPLRDDSVNGTVPDANGDGNPTNDSSPTPFQLAIPAIRIAKTASEPRRVAASEWEVDFTLTVTNTAKTPATYVRVADNLNCTFRSYESPAPVQSWRLVGAPKIANGLLQPNPGYTGAAPCTPEQIQNANPFLAMPADPRVTLTNGLASLAPGASEVLRFTARFLVGAQARAQDLRFMNQGYAGIYDQPGAEGARVVAASAGAPFAALDPSGVVYNAKTREPVAGALVTLRRLACEGAPAAPITAEQLLPMPDVTYTFNGDGSVSMPSEAASGHYHFYVKTPPVATACDYGLSVAPPADGALDWPSAIIPPTPGAAPGGAVQVQPQPPTGTMPTTYYLRTRLGPGLPELWNDHIPVDPATSKMNLFLEKKANRFIIEIGGSVRYTLVLKNSAPTRLTSFVITDQMPPGFRYVAGTTRLNDKAAPDPAVDRLTLRFEAPAVSLEPGETLTLEYLTQSGAATPVGDAVNTAQASSGHSVSNVASRKVRVEGGVFSEEAYLIGKVYLDCDQNGVQDPGEPGIPGVRLFLEDGTGVVTDVEGKYSLYGLRAITHVLKLDATTLPPGAWPELLDNRNAGRADSRFVDLKKGELHKGDFPIGNCRDPQVRDEIVRRRLALASEPEAEGIAVSRSRLELQPQLLSVDQVRSRDASGQLTVTGPTKQVAGAASGPAGQPGPAPQVFEPVMPRGLAEATEPSAIPLGPPPTGLEDVLPTLDNVLAFVDLKDRDTLPLAVANVRVKGFLGARLQLTVNGRVQGDSRIGKRARILDRSIEAWEYIGVELHPGENTLVLDELDPGGNRRATVSITVIAPGAPGRIEIDAPQTAVADGATRIPIRVRLTDDKGVPVTARTQLTLEIDNGRWDVKDLNPNEPGTQVFMEGGQAEFNVLPPNDPLDAIIRVTAASLRAEIRLAYVPEMRPLIGAGILEGVLDFRHKGVLPVGQTARDAFEQTLRNMSHESSDGTRSANARLALYLKGTVKGEYLLTLAYDSDKSTRERLFRDIQPDQFYPIYGDSATKLFDAQSTERLYLRIDHGRSWLLYGDFVTAAENGDVRRLSQYNRAATGLKYHHEDANVSGNLFARRDSLTQIVLEFPANGTSGPYPLAGGGELKENSEKVEIVVRDRRQPAVILRTVPLTRFTDYILEPLTKQLRFGSPVASLDENLNPRYIRVIFEADSGGPVFWVAGGDVQVKLNESVQVGASVARDDNPVNPVTIAGVTAVVKLDPRSVITAEYASTDTGESGRGSAARIEWLKETERLKLRAQATVSDEHFDNITAGFGKGRTDASLDATYQIDSKTTFRTEGIYTKDDIAGQERAGLLATIARPLGENVRGEVGLRVSRDTAPLLTGLPGAPTATPAPPAGEPLDTVALRGRLNARVPMMANAQVYIEGEQDLRESSRRMLAIGGDYQLTPQARVYGRYELISSLGNPYALTSNVQNNVAVIGLETSYLQDGRTFNEFRLRDAINGRELQAATGVRKTWAITDRLRLGGSYESTRAFGGVPGSNSTAVTGSLEYSSEARLRIYAALEARAADTGDSWLSTAGVAYKVNNDWSLLGRTATSHQKNAGDGSTQILSRQQLGFAWRQVDIDRWNALGRYEHRLAEIEGGPNPARDDAHALSLSLNYQPGRATIVNGRYAFKWGEELVAGQSVNFQGHLLYGRLTQDVTDRIDLSLQAAMMRGSGDTGRYALGLEAGMQLFKGLWGSIGYNVVGISANAVTSGEHLDQGAYVRLRYKFDEEVLK